MIKREVVTILKLFEKLPDILDEKLHSKFKLLLKPEFYRHREIIQGWVEGFVDRDNKIIKEFQTTFHSSFWEFYLFALFKELNFELDQTHDRPDFIIKAPEEIYIEAVVPEINDKTGIPESMRDMDDIISMFIPPYEQTDFYKVLDEAIIRQSNSILKKRNNYIKNYSKCDWIDEKPYVIALSSYDQINYGREFIYPMLALLYGMYYVPEKEDYEIRNSVKKDNGADIPIGIFNNPDYSNISAIIYSSTITIGKLTSLSISNGKRSTINEVYGLYKDYKDSDKPYKLNIVSPETPEELSDGVFIFHNPNAKHKLPLTYFESSNITQYFINDSELNFSLDSRVLVARIDTIPLPGMDTTIIEYVRHYNKMSMKDFYNVNPITGEPLNTNVVDFLNDSCVFIISEDINGDEDDVLIYSFERPIVMSDKMLNNEAMKIAKILIQDKQMGELLGIYIARNQEQYDYIKDLFCNY